MNDITPNTETELKLSIQPIDVPRLHACDLFAARSRGQAVTRLLESVYFDTPDFRLRQGLVTLRVRKQGDRYIQTVKTAGDGLRRGEWETAVTEPAPNLAAIVDPDALRHLGAVTVADLRPVFETRVQRSLYRLDDDAIEVAIDRGQILAGNGATEEVSEVELELKQGKAGDLYQLALALAERTPVRLESRTKAERGFALAIGERRTFSKAKPLALSPDTTVEAALSAIVRHCLTHLAENEACALGGEHPEGIHQMRVAMRRLRSVLSVFRAVIPAEQRTRLAGEVKWLFSELGTARDWDVFAADLLAPVRTVFRDDPGFTADFAVLADVVDRQRRRGLERARRAILSPRTTRLQLQFGQWLENRGWRAQPESAQSARLFQPIGTFAAGILNRRYKKLHRLGADLARLSVQERHQLRIVLKKLRYAGDFFRSLFDERDTRCFLDGLSDLQDVLGQINDMATARRLLGDLAADQAAPGAADAVVARASGVLLGWYARGNAELDQALLRAWKASRGVKVFWRRP